MSSLGLDVMLTARVPSVCNNFVSIFFRMHWWLSYWAGLLVFLELLMDTGISYLTFPVALVGNGVASRA